MLTFGLPPLRLPSEQKKRRVGDLRPTLKVIGVAQLSNLVQKCDAKRPCETCIQAKCASVCTYDDEQGPYPVGVRPLHSADSRLPGSQLGDADPVEISTPSTDGVFTDMLSPARLNLIRFVPDSTWVVTDGPSASQQVPHSHSSGLVLVHRNSNSPEQCISPDTSPSIHTIFLPPTIPPEPWVPLPFLGAEKSQIQISDIDATDLDMRSCVLEYESIGHELIL